MSDKVKLEVISILQTFGATFIVAVCAEIANGQGIQWTSTFFAAVILAGVRSGIKAVIQKILPEDLGGVKKA